MDDGPAELNLAHAHKRPVDLHDVLTSNDIAPIWKQRVLTYDERLMLVERIDEVLNASKSTKYFR